MVYNTREYTKHFIDTNIFRMLEENNTFIFRYASLFLARSNKKKEISYWNEEANSTNRQSWKVDSNTSFHGTRVAWLKSMDKKKKKKSRFIVNSFDNRNCGARNAASCATCSTQDFDLCGGQTNSASLRPIVSTQWLIPRFRPGKIFYEGEFSVFRFKKKRKNSSLNPISNDVIRHFVIEPRLLK